MDRSNHYETAFEAYLQWHRLSYVAVDESRRSYLGEERVKSLDFLVHSAEAGAGWLIDVKGRRYPSGPPERPRHSMECWSTLEDVDGLTRWAERFGIGFRALFVFAYQLTAACRTISPGEDLWTYHDHRYLYRAVAVDEYRLWMKRRSPRWGTVSLSVQDFRRLSRPFHEYVFTASRKPWLASASPSNL